jgi:uncharacterized protein
MRSPVFSFILVLLVVPYFYGQGTTDKRQPIIDMHLHGYPSNFDLSKSVNPVTGKLPPYKSGAEHMKATIAEMKRLNIVKGFVSVGEGPPEVEMAIWESQAPGRIVPSYGLFLGTSELPDLGEFEKAFAEKRFLVLGEVGAQYAGLSLSDPKLEPYLAIAEKYDIPVGIHTGLSFPGVPYDPCCPKFRTHLGNPQTIEEALVRHPKLRIYLMHGGVPFMQETIAIMSLYPQVYADIAVIDWIGPRELFHDYLRTMIKHGFGKRLMFGSDQMHWAEAIEMAIEGVESADFLSEEQKRDIFCNNAARFLKWEGKDDPCRIKDQ